MLFSKDQIKELLNLISYHQVLFIAHNVGTEVLTKEDLVVLKQFGVDTKSISGVPIMNQAFKFGVLAQILGDKKTQTLTYEDFKSYIKRGQYIPLNRREDLTLDRVKHQAYKDIKSLGNKIGDFVYQKIIEKEAKSAVENRKSVKELASELGHQTDDWSRDFGRISDYILHSAYEEGRVSAIEESYGDSFIYRDVYPGACKHCIALYLTDGIGSQPRLFKISQVRANGTNIGRKAIEWKPVLNSTHPFCRCTWNNLPEGYVWNNEAGMFLPPPINKKGRTATVKVTVGNKKFEA